MGCIVLPITYILTFAAAVQTMISVLYATKRISETAPPDLVKP
ncbi:Uncharacterised protein [uncultured archaeon]|nr:Uncharacterised protein [uncultured archaeon]